MRRVAVVGAGMTNFVRRAQETPKELAYQASSAALDSCGLRLKDIECVAHGSAPDAFDGIHQKGEYLADGSGGWNKPTMRVFVGGATGVHALIHGWQHVASGMFDTCLVVCEEKMSSAMPHAQAFFLTIFDHTTERPLHPNLIWIFSMEMHRYMHRYGYTKQDMALASMKNKNQGLKHPASQFSQEVSLQEILDSEVLAYPVSRLDVSPVTDGAAAVVLASENVARRLTDQPVWIEGTGWCLDTSYWATRDLYYPRYCESAARMAYDMAGIKEPEKQIDIAEPYDPFGYKALHHMEGLLLSPKGKTVELLRDGHFDQDGELPMCPSGGLLGVGNPIAAAGTMKICELFWQLRGEAGQRQVPGQPRLGVAQAWGDLLQVSSVAVLGV
ncbi:MAG: thiolase domain-containing protein [Desulfohalobiaceae bacterium]